MSATKNNNSTAIQTLSLSLLLAMGVSMRMAKVHFNIARYGELFFKHKMQTPSSPTVWRTASFVRSTFLLFFAHKTQTQKKTTILPSS